MIPTAGGLSFCLLYFPHSVLLSDWLFGAPVSITPWFQAPFTPCSLLDELLKAAYPSHHCSCLHLTAAHTYLSNAWTAGSWLRTWVVCSPAYSDPGLLELHGFHLNGSKYCLFLRFLLGVPLIRFDCWDSDVGPDQTCHELWTCYSFLWDRIILHSLNLSSFLLSGLCTFCPPAQCSLCPCSLG